jgi:nitroimidazol reductase NimA-like FMN-containing flavoprotein (pyridoxamine 5'-phosphate oxidase superfamily)
MDAAIRRKILDLLAAHRTMTVATLRPDGWPQATTVGYVNNGLVLAFLCARDSQKAANILRDDRISLTIDRDTTRPDTITGLSMAARAKPMNEPEEIAKVLRLLADRFPEYVGPLPPPDYRTLHVMRVVPELISVLDYSKGFGHTDLVTVTREDASPAF